MKALLACLLASLQAPPVETTVGIEARITVRTHHAVSPRPPVDPELGQERDLLVRVVEQRELAEGGRELVLAFLAERPGDYDLAEFLALPSGETPDELEPIPVRVTALLPDDHRGELEAGARVGTPRYGALRPWLIGAAVLWLLPLAVFVVRRALRRTPQPEPPAPLPTLVERLEPLVEAAIAGTLDTDGKAELDRLLLTYWREHLGLEGLGHARAIARLREDAEAGALLVAVERWLHAKHSGEADAARVRALLEPYRAPGDRSPATSGVAEALAP